MTRHAPSHRSPISESFNTGPPWIALLALVLFLWAAPRFGAAQISCAPEPPNPPKRISGGEAFPPLPLPVTPLRPTARKRSPAPPTLMAKVNYGATRVQSKGREVWQWTTATGDTHNLFKNTRSVLGINYKADVVRLDKFEYSPETVPIMYFTGREGFSLDETQRRALKRYVLKGGAILGAAGNGNGVFSESFVREMRAIFPDRPWHALPPDHPLFHSHYALKSVAYRRDEEKPKKSAPKIEGLNVGCRTAVVLSRADLSCGWDNHTHPDGFRVMPADAKRLGANLMAYVLASYRLGRVNSVPILFRSAQGTAGDVDVGQIVHGGDWDPCPSSTQFFLKEVAKETSAGVDYRRVAVDLEKGDLFQYPFLFLTGHLDFELSKKSVANLRAYLTRGGFLLVSNCCNRSQFDRAVRRELKRVLPNNKLEVLGGSHPVFSTHFNLAAKSSRERLEGVTLEEAACVIYSPGSIATAWDNEPRPFVDLPDPETARRVGVNALVYAMMY